MAMRPLPFHTMRMVVDPLPSRAANGAVAAVAALFAVVIRAGVDLALSLALSRTLQAGIPFFMVRKAGKMPNTITSAAYETEYDKKDGLALQRDAVKPGDKVRGGVLGSLERNYGGNRTKRNQSARRGRRAISRLRQLLVS